MDASRLRRTLFLLAMALPMLLSAADADVFVQCPPDTDGIDTDGDGIVDNDHVCMHMAAGDGFANMADGELLYIFGFSDVSGTNDETAVVEAMLGAEFPGPTIVVKEGQKLYLTLTNVGMIMRPDLFDPHTIHWHGFPNAAPVFDGVPAASMAINMMASLTYFYNIVEPGTFMWHCHVEATEHMQMGMLAQIYVLPMQNNLPDGTDLNGFTHHTGYKYVYNDGDGSTYYDVEYPIQLGSFDPNFHEASLTVQPLQFNEMNDTYAMLNGRGYPDTIYAAPIANTWNGNLSQKIDAVITADPGDKILLRLSNLSTTDYFTVTALGIPMRIVGTGARLLRGPDGEDLSYDAASVTLGGGEAADAILDTGGLAPGTYFLYTSNFNYLSNYTEDFGGMMTEIYLGVDPPGGGEAPPSPSPPEGVLTAVGPGDGSTVSAYDIPTFIFDYGGTALTEFTIEIAPVPDFSTSMELVATSPYVLSANQWKAVKRWFRKESDPANWVLYWRAAGFADDGSGSLLTAANRFTIDGGVIHLVGPADGSAAPIGVSLPEFTYSDSMPPWVDRLGRKASGKYMVEFSATGQFGGEKTATYPRKGTSAGQVSPRRSIIRRIGLGRLRSVPVTVYWRVVAQDQHALLMTPSEETWRLEVSR